MITVTMYTSRDCAACDQVEADLAELQDEFPHLLVKVDVDRDAGLRERYQNSLPALEVGPYRRKYPFTKEDLRVMVSAASDRVSQLKKVDQEGYQMLVTRGLEMNSSDKISLFLSKHYLLLVQLILVVYVGLPFLAPVLMENNLTAPANAIYKIYSVMCHQLAFRSWFLFGEQPYYPRALAGVPNATTYEQLTNSPEIDYLAARSFEGDEHIGFKVALCERDVAIYGFMVIFGLIFALTGRKMRSIPWYFWVVLGVVPMGLDGVSQLPSAIQGLPGWFPIRESTPLLRTLTGGLFGWMTAWYVFPMLEETMRDARIVLTRKQAVIEQSKAKAGS